MLQDSGTLALQLLADLLVVALAACELLLLLLDGLLHLREAIGLVEELALAPPLA